LIQPKSIFGSRYWCTALAFITVLSTAAPAGAKARSPSRCSAILERNYSLLALREQPNGKAVYQKLREALSGGTTFAEFNDRMRARNPPIREVLRFIQKDRARLVDVLRDSQATLTTKDALYWLIARTIDKMTNRNPQKRGDDSQFDAIIAEIGNQPWRNMARAEAPWSEAQSIVCNYFLRNYSFISELMTALEVKGLLSSGDNINQMVSHDAYDNLADHLENRNSENLENLELDAVTMDYLRGVMTWFEVKHVNRRIEAYSDFWFDRLSTRQRQLEKLKRIIESDKDLRAAFADRIEIRYVIRGAGISRAAQQRFRRQFGMEVESGTPDGYNAQFGKPKPRRR
jgi:hypothetical protein